MLRYKSVKEIVLSLKIIGGIKAEAGYAEVRSSHQILRNLNDILIFNDVYI